MKIKQLFQGTIISRLLTIFLLTGVLPAVVIAAGLVFVLSRQNQAMVTELDQQLQHRAERSLLTLSNDRAARYNHFFENQAHNAQQLADYLSQVTAGAPEQENGSWNLLDQAYLHPSGWWVNGPDPGFGFLMSPLARLDRELMDNQAHIAAAEPAFTSLVCANPEIRTVFTITEDQTLWIYPNRLWMGEEFFVPQLSDLSTRPYYRETDQVVWAIPYVDVEPVLTVAAPIWVEGEFYGMAGVDFTLETLLAETLHTQVGTDGFMFLVDRQSQVVAMPEAAREYFLREDLLGGPEGLIGLSLQEVVPDPMARALESSGMGRELSRGEPFLLDVELDQGPAYLAFSPLESVPWYVGVVQPAGEVTQFARGVETQVQTTARTILLLSMGTGIGFILVILFGGVITYRRLVHPIQSLDRGAREISRGHLEHRVPVDQGGTELSRLTETFNVMASSVQTMQEDIKEQEKVLSETLARRETEFHALTEMSALLNRPEDLPKNFSQVLSIIQQVLGSDLAALSLVEENGQVSYTVQEVGPSLDPDLVDEPHCEVHIADALIDRVTRSRETLEIEQISSLLPDLPADKVRCFQEAGIQSVYLIPVLANQRVRAVLTLMWIESRQITGQMWGFIEPVLKQLALLIEHTQLRQQSRDLVIFEERRRMARELHDSVTQSLFTLRLMVEGLDPGLPEELEELQEPLQLISQQVEVIQGEMRRLINELRPVHLKEHNFRTALERHLNSLRSTTGLEVSMSSTGPVDRIPRRKAENLNRIVQEALHNVAQHAGASRVEVNVRVEEELVVLRVEDDGGGFDPQQAALSENQSLGLLSMRERAEILKGALVIRSRPGDGTVLTVKVPL